ncbi:YrhK family protein [Halothiobacillus sp.]|uniref:YrhK family protein n=1 Tax=Halothiobacillus sp. TaxID=1891311 RepID=UPI002AD533DA|nr:YrhK family protein [Halothiobacillus sp.]
MNTPPAQDNNLVVQLGNEELIIHQRYEVALIFNDFLIALWFVIGSACFLVPRLSTLGAWIFLFASLQFMVRPLIGLIRHLHLKRLQTQKHPE